MPLVALPLILYLVPIAFFDISLLASSTVADVYSRPELLKTLFGTFFAGAYLLSLV